MRSVRISKTFNLQLVELLDAGEVRFGQRVIDEKRALVFAAIRNQIAHFPAAKQPHPKLALIAYPVSRTPFVVLYDFDDAEIRIHFVVHSRTSLDDVDPAAVEW